MIENDQYSNTVRALTAPYCSFYNIRNPPTLIDNVGTTHLNVNQLPIALDGQARINNSLILNSAVQVPNATTTAPTNTTNVSFWIPVTVGTNTYAVAAYPYTSVPNPVGQWKLNEYTGLIGHDTAGANNAYGVSTTYLNWFEPGAYFAGAQLFTFTPTAADSCCVTA